MPPRFKGQCAQIVGAVLQQIVSAHEHRELCLHLRADRLAVEPLLQIAETAHSDCAIAVVADQQFTIQRTLEIHGGQQIGEGTGNVVARARIDARHAPLAGHLHTDAVPLPFGAVVRRIVFFEFIGVGRCREHHGPEGRGCRVFGLVGLAFEPSE